MSAPETPPGFFDKLSAGLCRCGANGKRIVVGVSGGADSVALLRGLVILRDSANLEIRAAHMNHQLRGADSDADADWVRALCDRLAIPCAAVSVEIHALAEHQRRGVEETARDERYEFLSTIAQRHECGTIAVAHTADDQAETVLHHILRGTGLTGLRGIAWSRPVGHVSNVPDLKRHVENVPHELIRPMLAIWRCEVEAFLSEIGQDFRTDVSNLDTSLTRNRLRHELLPLLEREFNSQTREHLCQLAEQAADWEVESRAAADLLLQKALLDRSQTTARLRCDELEKESRHLIREAFALLWQDQRWPRQQMTFSHWDALAEMIQSGKPTAMNLPGDVFVRRRGTLLAIEWPRAA